ncbi:MAG TPA: hypothetical protein VF666_03925 [Pyrinomonadaceae bacterium]|jgi:hydroxypyruvate isomerase
MSNPYDPHRDKDLNAPVEPIDDLMLRDDDDDYPGDEHRGERVSTSVRETLSSIGRDISRTIERAIAAKDDYVVAVKVTPEAQDKLEQLVQAGVFRTRAEAAAFLIDEGVKAQSELFNRVQQKLSEIERLRSELRGMINNTPTP